MTDIEKKFIFTVIGFLILIMIVVLSIKSSNKNKLEQQKASENNTQLEDYVTSFEKIGSDVKVNNNEDLAKTHYGEHADKPFFGSLIEYITSSPSLAMVIEGEEAISTIRKLVGATNPLEADLGTIRGDFAMDTGRNIIHASDSPDSAEREINLFFNEDEICDYEIVDNKLIYE